jgi:hypothetical protein
LYVAECPEVGTVSQGETIEEAVINLKEATELYLGGIPAAWGGSTVADDVRSHLCLNCAEPPERRRFVPWSG